MDCPNCEAMDWPSLPDGTYTCSVCHQTYYLRTSGARTAPPQITHHCPNCEAAQRELADIAAVLRTGSSGDTLLGKEVSRWIDTAHAAEQERDDLHTLCDKQADILSRVAIALRGPEPPQTKWSHHDLPERAAKIKQEIAHLHAGILRIIEDYPRDIKQDAEEALRALADGVAAPMSSNSDLWAHPIICACGDHIGYAESIGLSQDGAVCGNCAVSRKDYDARTDLATLRAGIAEVLDMYPQSIEQGPQDELRDLLRKDAK